MTDGSILQPGGRRSAGPHVEDWEDRLGLNHNTLLRWLGVPEFRTDYFKARREAVYQSVARIQHATGAAAITILKLMTDPNVPAAVRLRAAECVFDHSIKGIELLDTEARLAALEQAAEESKPESRADLTSMNARHAEQAGGT
jgi:hypothetical protein